jgi:hypothetical protein
MHSKSVATQSLSLSNIGARENANLPTQLKPMASPAPPPPALRCHACASDMLLHTCALPPPCALLLARRHRAAGPTVDPTRRGQDSWTRHEPGSPCRRQRERQRRPWLCARPRLQDSTEAPAPSSSSRDLGRRHGARHGFGAARWNPP